LSQIGLKTNVPGKGEEARNWVEGPRLGRGPIGTATETLGRGRSFLVKK